MDEFGKSGILYIIVKSIQVTINVDIVQGENAPVITDDHPKIEAICDICGKKVGVYDKQASANRALSVHQSQHCKGYPTPQPTPTDLVDKLRQKRF